MVFFPEHREDLAFVLVPNLGKHTTAKNVDEVLARLRHFVEESQGVKAVVATTCMASYERPEILAYLLYELDLYIDNLEQYIGQVIWCIKQEGFLGSGDDFRRHTESLRSYYALFPNISARRIRQLTRPGVPHAVTYTFDPAQGLDPAQGRTAIFSLGAVLDNLM